MFSRSQPRPRDSTSEHAGSGVHAEEALMRAKHRKAWLGCQAASSSDLPKNAEAGRVKTSERFLSFGAFLVHHSGGAV